MELIGTGGDDTLTGGNDNDTISGDAGNDLLDGAGGNDSILGGGGDDSLLGGDGDDSLYGGKGNDTIEGGANGLYGDTVFYSVTNAVNVNLVTGVATDGSNGTDMLIGIENVHGGDGNDVLTGNASDNLFSLGQGNDTVNGGDGIDTVTYAAVVNEPVSVNLATGTATGATIDTDHLSSIEKVIGSAFDDTLAGSTGNDIFVGGFGNDVITGNSGIDLVSYATSESGVEVTLAGSSSSAADDGMGSTDTLSGIEKVEGSAFDDTLVGSGAAFEGFDGGAGDDDIDGMGGTDLASYASSTAAVSVNLATGTASDGLGGTDSLANIEMVVGSAFDDTLTGGTGNDDLDGGAGNDSINGGAGNDTLEGGGGDDTLVGGTGNDIAVFSGNFDEYFVSSVVDGELSVAGPEGFDTLRDIELIEFADLVFTVVEGSDANDTLAGTAGPDALFGGEGTDSIGGGEGDDLLDGGDGADTMAGGGGDDTYIVDDEGDVVNEDADAAARALRDGPGTFDIGGGIDRVVASINYTLGNFVENLNLSGAGNLAGTGNSLSNALAGNAGNNVLTGGGGNDALNGGDGVDVAAFGASRNQYDLTIGTANLQVSDNAAQEGTDTLEEVERLRFADVSLALDLSGNAGRVAKILGAVFGSESVSNEAFVGIGLGVADSGMSYEALMQLALNFRLGAGASNTAIVDLLYTNVVGFHPDDATLNSFVGLLDNGTFTPGSLGVLAADHSLNASHINLAGLAETGLEYL